MGKKGSLALRKKRHFQGNQFTIKKKEENTIQNSEFPISSSAKKLRLDLEVMSSTSAQVHSVNNVAMGYRITHIPTLIRAISDNNIVRNGNIKIGDLSFEGLEKFKYLGATVTNINDTREEIKRRINMGNACYYSIEKLLSSSLLSKNLKVRIYKTVILPVVLYGCETWTLTLREEHRLRVFENKVLRKIFGAKRDEVTGEWRKLHNAELHALYSSPDIITNIKSRRLRWAGHVARMGESRNAYCNNECGRSFQTRYKEHITAITKLQNTSTYAKHITNANHTYRDINTDMEILHIQPKSQKLNSLEQYEIYKHTKTHPNDILNTQLNFKVHTLFDSTLRMHPHRKQEAPRPTTTSSEDDPK
ncbi:hypothetical protein ANN_13208 [Periplaneta americana]|uniref:Endonuclease-reverse transcriptase n=1 Tax=Periplaneta americana TaxID=6978 RepID=A0ABQ8TKL2_PERAM|nr:hypothetical protein ANN_13208 [Periplaneta americana]